MSYNLCRDDTVAKRFWKKVEKTSTCWNWIGGLFSDGYGHIGDSRGGQKAHRVSYELHTGPIPDGLVVMHSCDNRVCVNPAHLSVGSPTDNTKDRDLKQRGSKPKGVANPMAKLLDYEVRLIRTLPVSTALAADLFKVSGNTITRIRANKTWRHL